MPRGVYDRNPKEIPAMASETTTATEPAKLFPVILLKNYVPKGEYKIVGYLKEAVKQKDAAGNWRIIEPETFIEGEVKPHQSPGVGYGAMVMKDGSTVNAKIWAGTQIRVPVEEAKYVVAKKIAERADGIAA
jgi:hypothetical protein